MSPAELTGLLDAPEARAGSAPLALVRRGLIQLRLAEHTDTRQRYDRAEADMDEAVYRAPDGWPWPWYGLARAKLALAELGVTAKASMHQPEGDTYRSAAFRALAHSLEADSSFAPAAALLAEALLPLGERDLSGDLQRAVRRAATSGAGPAPLLALGRVFGNLGKPDSALAAFQGFVAAGGASGVGLLEQARALHALGNAAGAGDARGSGSRLPDSGISRVRAGGVPGIRRGGRGFRCGPPGAGPRPARARQCGRRGRSLGPGRGGSRRGWPPIVPPGPRVDRVA